MLSVPEPQPNDPEDLSTALETAAIFSAQGDVREAVRWVRRAAELAGDAGDDMRALTLARAVADLGASVSPQPPSQAAAPAPEPAPAPAPEPMAAPVDEPTIALPPPPPLPDRAATSSGDRITSPGPGPETLSRPPVPQAEATSSGPRSTPPQTADDGWSDDDQATPWPKTNGASNGAPVEAAPAPAPEPVVAPAVAAPEPAALPEPPPLPPLPAREPAVAKPVVEKAVAAPAPAPAPATPTPLSAARARVEATNEAGVFRVTLLAAGETAGPAGQEALLVLLDPSAKLV